MARRRALFIGILAAGGCADPDPGPADPAPVAPCPSGEIDDDGACVPEACGLGPWGHLADAGDTVFVDDDAVGPGDGSTAAPVPTVAEGLALAVDRGAVQVALADGTYREAVDLGDDHRGITLAGRCTARVTLDGSSGDEVPAVSVRGDRRTPDVTLTGLTVTGGTAGGLLVNRANLVVEDLVLGGNHLYGLGAERAEVSLTRVLVTDTEPGADGDWGLGLLASDGAGVVGSDVVLVGNTMVGLTAFNAGTTVSLSTSEVSGTVATADRAFGRGVEVQDGAAFDCTGCTISDNAEFGVWMDGTSSSLRLETVELAGNTGAGLLVIGGDAELVDTTVAGTHPSPTTGQGAGIDVEGGASLVCTRCTVAANPERGVFASGVGTMVSLDDTVVDATFSPGPGQAGNGVLVQGGATLGMVGGMVSGSVGAGVAATGAGSTLDVDGTSIEGSVQSADGAPGRGAGVADGATATLRGVTLRSHTGAGVTVADPGSSLTLADSTVVGTLALADGTAGRGASVEPGGHLAVSGGVFEGNAESGIWAMGDGVTLELSGVSVRENLGRGLQVGTGVVLVADGLEVDGNVDIGLLVVGATTSAVLTEVVIRDTTPGAGDGRGLDVESGATVTITGGVVEGNHSVGVLANADTLVELVDVEVRGTRRGPNMGLALGAAAQSGGRLYLDGGRVSETEGPGLYSAVGTVEAVGTTIEGNRFAGAATVAGELVLTEVTVVDTAADAEWGGGFGVYALASRAPVVTLRESEVGPHPHAAVWLDGPGSYEIDGNTLYGSEGFLLGATPVHGNAVYATHGVGPWDGTTGLHLARNSVTDAGTVAVLLHGASATLEGNTWSRNTLDVRQQACAGIPALLDAELGAVPTWERCPERDVLVDFATVLGTLYMPESVAAE